MLGPNDPREGGSQHWPLRPGRYRAVLALDDGQEPWLGYEESHIFTVKPEGRSCPYSYVQSLFLLFVRSSIIFIVLNNLS